MSLAKCESNITYVCDSMFKIRGKMLHKSSWDRIRNEINGCTGTKVWAGGAPEQKLPASQEGPMEEQAIHLQPMGHCVE